MRREPDEADLLVHGDEFRRRMALVHALVASGGDRLSDQAQVLAQYGETLQAYSLVGPTSFGTGEDCDVSLCWGGVSGRHCLIAPADDDWFVEDMQSEGGTYVNDTRVTEALLKEGDVVRIGQGCLIFLSSVAGLRNG